MRVLYIHSSADNLAGSEMVLVKILERLDDGIHKIVALPEEGPFATLLRERGFEPHIVDLHVAETLDPRPRLRSIGQFFRLLGETRPHLIHASSATPVQYAWLPARVLGIPLTCHIQAPYARDELDACQVHRADRLFLVSHFLGEFFDERYRGKLEVVYSGIELPGLDRGSCRASLCEEFHLKPDAPLVGIVGQIIHRKGIDTLLTAGTRLVSRYPDVRILVAGNHHSEYGRELQALAHGLHIEDHVIWTGFRRDVPRLMAALDLLVVPSRSEGLGLVAAEALAAGTPVIASRTGGLREIVEEGDNGLLVPVDSVDALAHAIDQLLSDPDLRRRMGRSGQEMIRTQFSPAREIAHIRRIYEELVRAARRRPRSWISRG